MEKMEKSEKRRNPREKMRKIPYILENHVLPPMKISMFFLKSFLRKIPFVFSQGVGVWGPGFGV